MSDWQSRFESVVDRLIHEAEDRGEFDNLPGAGKPLPGIDEPYSDDWWLKELARRENLGAYALPGALRLRKEGEELVDSLMAARDESAVRTAVADYNRRVRESRLRPQAGPPILVHTLDEDDVVARWRARR